MTACRLWSCGSIERQMSAEVLDQAVALAPDDADAHYALLRVRQGRRGEAVAPLRRAAELRPEEVRLA